MASQAKLTLRPPPNVEFVQGFPGIPPLLPDRPPSCVKGAVEVRLGGGPVKAKWIKVELRKVETLPGGGQANTYIELIGESPLIVWQSREEWDELVTHDFPFQIRIPEAIPPSIALERNAGIKYELVASVLVKGKRGLLRREATPILSSSCQIVIDKHELHSTWPIYAQPETRSKPVDGHTLSVNRTHTAFGPGDRIAVQTIVKNDARQTNHIRYYEFALLELVVYRPGPQGGGRKSGPQLRRTPIQEQRIPITITSPLHPGMQAKAELSLQVPMTHTTTTVSYAQRIEVNYVIHVKAVLAGGQQLALDLPVTMSNWTRPQSIDAVRRIGYAPNLSGPEQHRPASMVDPRLSQVSLVQPTKSANAWATPAAPMNGGMIPNGFGLPNGAQSPFVPGVQTMQPPQQPPNDFGGGWNYQGPNGAATMGGMPQRIDPMDEFGRAPNGMQRPVTYNGVSYNVPSTVPNVVVQNPSPQANGVNGTGSPSDGGSDDRQAQRRPRAGSAAVTTARFTVVNGDADHESDLMQNGRNSMPAGRYPTAEEEKRRLQEAMNKVDAQGVLAQQPAPNGDAPEYSPNNETAGASSSQPSQSQPAKQWLSAEEEKARMAQQNAAYESARQRADRLQRAAAEAHQNQMETRPVSPPSNPAPVRQSTVQSPGYPSAAEEKFRAAQAMVERTQAANTTAGIGYPIPRGPNGTVWAAEGSSAGAVMSPGKALYQSALATMRSSTLNSPAGPASTSSNHSSQGYKSSAEEKAELRYRQAIEAAQAVQGNAYVGGPVPYEALFPAGGPSTSNAPPATQPIMPLNVNRDRSPSASSVGPTDALAEKERVRRAFAAADAAAAASNGGPTSPQPSTSASTFSNPATPRADAPPARTSSFMSAPSSPPLPPPAAPNGVLTAFEEKERLKAKYAEEDAQQAGASAATPFYTPVQTPKATASNQSWIPQPALPPRPPPSLPSPPLSNGMNGDAYHNNSQPLSAAEEKALLKAKYAEDGVRSGSVAPPPVPPPRPTSVAVSDNLRRDPSILLGKQKAPAEPSPPPLPEKPPAAYYMHSSSVNGLDESEDAERDPYHDLTPGELTFSPLDIRPFSPFDTSEFSPSFGSSAGGARPPLPPKVPL